MEVPPGCVDAGDPIGGRGLRIGRQPISDRFEDCRSRVGCFRSRVFGRPGISDRFEDCRSRV